MLRHIESPPICGSHQDQRRYRRQLQKYVHPEVQPREKPLHTDLSTPERKQTPQKKLTLLLQRTVRDLFFSFLFSYAFLFLYKPKHSNHYGKKNNSPIQN
jgi:hypothetical protein